MMPNILRLAHGRPKGPIIMLLAVFLAFSSLTAEQTGHFAALSLRSPGIRDLSLPSAPFSSAAAYDEQVGVTFTQDLATLAFNVTAIAYPDNGIGPGYLVNALTDQGYWYQVGLSYDWPMTSGTVNPGFRMNYEVFAPTPHICPDQSLSQSIYPTDFGGGIQAFKGTVNIGDSVLLSLSFSQGSIVMQAMDWQTPSVSQQSFNAYARNKVFIGLTSDLAQSGFFSGLMTEQYHYSPYYSAGLPVTYSVSGSLLTSVWMWMDEWNTNNGQSVFRANTTSPVMLDSSIGTYFSSNGTAEVATTHNLVTGLTPAIFPRLLAGSQSTGQPGHHASVNLVIEDQGVATVRFDNITISTSFGRYNFTLETPFSLGSGVGQYSVTIDIPTNLALGAYNLTIHVRSWNYLDTQTQAWIRLGPDAINETLVVTNNPPLPPSSSNGPGPSTPSSGQGPASSTNVTRLSIHWLVAVLSSVVIPAVGSYVALGFLAVALLIRQNRKRA